MHALNPLPPSSPLTSHRVPACAAVAVQVHHNASQRPWLRRAARASRCSSPASGIRPGLSGTSLQGVGLLPFIGVAVGAAAVEAVWGCSVRHSRLPSLHKQLSLSAADEKGLKRAGGGYEVNDREKEGGEEEETER